MIIRSGCGTRGWSCAFPTASSHCHRELQETMCPCLFFLQSPLGVDRSRTTRTSATHCMLFNDSQLRFEARSKNYRKFGKNANLSQRGDWQKHSSCSPSLTQISIRCSAHFGFGDTVIFSFMRSRFSTVDQSPVFTASSSSSSVVGRDAQLTRAINTNRLRYFIVASTSLQGNFSVREHGRLDPCIGPSKKTACTVCQVRALR